LSVLDVILLWATILPKFEQCPVNLMHNVILNPPPDTRRGIDIAEPEGVQMVFIFRFEARIEIIVYVVDSWLGDYVFITAAAALRDALDISWLELGVAFLLV
jgi:hypothetical protein